MSFLLKVYPQRGGGNANDFPASARFTLKQNNAIKAKLKFQSRLKLNYSLPVSFWGKSERFCIYSPTEFAKVYK